MTVVTGGPGDPGGRAALAERSPRRRMLRDRAFVLVCLAATGLSVLVLLVLLGAIVVQGWHHLDWRFLTSWPSRKAEKAGLKAALWGSVWLCVVCAAAALPLGIGAAVLLEEYKPRGRALRALHGLVQLNITNLAGVPSIVYGIIGLTMFVRCFGLFGSPNESQYDRLELVTLVSGETILGALVERRDDALVINNAVRGRVELPAARIADSREVFARAHVFELTDGTTVLGDLLSSEDGVIRVLTPEHEERRVPAADVAGYTTKNMIQLGRSGSLFYLRVPLGRSVLAGGLTLMLVVLPIVIISAREALRGVPASLREGALAAGATRWQMVWRMVLPASVPGIMTGAILAMSRAIGEAAPLMVMGGLVYITFVPQNLMSDFATMPLQIFNWAGRPREEFQRVAASGIIVLLVALLLFNALAVAIRHRFQKPMP